MLYLFMEKIEYSSHFLIRQILYKGNMNGSYDKRTWIQRRYDLFCCKLLATYSSKFTDPTKPFDVCNYLFLQYPFHRGNSYTGLLKQNDMQIIADLT